MPLMRAHGGLSDMRVFLGPYNVAGNLCAYKIGLSELGVDAKVVEFGENKFGYPTDVQWEYTEKKGIRTLKKLPSLATLIPKFDIFHFVFGNSVLPHNFDVLFVKLLRKKIVVSFLGSDIRCSDKVLKGLKDRENCHECFRQCNLTQKMRRVKFWFYNANSIFSEVSCSQILDFLSIPYDVFVVPIDTDYWKPFKSSFYQKRENEVLIVHAPSVPAKKGTKFVLKAIAKLKAKGFNINFKQLTDEPHVKVREWLNISDIVVDQLIIGSYATLSVESMAMAKPTLCFIKEEYKKRLKYAKDLPLVNTSPNNIYENLETLIENPELRKTIGAEGRKYVEKVHDCKKLAVQLLKVYNSI